MFLFKTRGWFKIRFCLDLFKLEAAAQIRNMAYGPFGLLWIL